MDVLALTQQLIQVKSITDSENESEPILLIKKVLKEQGIACNIFGNGSKRSLVATIGEGNNSVLFNSHFDVVPAEDTLFVPHIREGKLYGRGSADAKGPLAAMICAFIALSQEKLLGKVILCCVCDEENAGKFGSKILTERHIVGTHHIIGEPTDNAMLISHRGFLRLTIIITGKEYHAALPHPKKNAIVLAGRVIQALAQFDFKASHKELGKATLSFGLISGGRKINIGAGECTIGIDIRYLPNQSRKKIIQQIQKRLDMIAKVQIKIIDSGTPFETEKSSLLVKSAQKAVQHFVNGANFGGTDARYYMPKDAIVLGPGKHEVAHQKEEYIAINDLHKAEKYYKEIVLKLLKGAS